MLPTPSHWTTVFLLALLPSVAHAQDDGPTMKKAMGREERLELMDKAKELFEVGINVSYNFFTVDALPSLEGKPPSYLADEHALERLTEALAKDPDDPVLHNNLGNHHKFHGNSGRARHHYERALSLLRPAALDGDTAAFHSFRGVLCLNLGMDSCMADMEEAIRRNPSDSIALLFYPMFLIQQGEYERVRGICSQVLDKEDDPYRLLAYIMLCTAEAMPVFKERLMPAMGDSVAMAALRALPYDRMMDFTLLDRFAARHAMKPEMARAHRMAKLIGLTMKLATARISDGRPIMPYTAAERAEVQRIVKVFEKESKDTKLTNQYGVRKSLAFAYFLLGDNERAAAHAERAIAIFPREHTDEQYHPVEVHDLVLHIHLANKDTAAFRAALERTIRARPFIKEDVRAHTLMGLHHLEKDDVRGAENWARSALAINRDHVPARSLLIHALMLQGLNSMAMFYAVGLEELATEPADQYTLLMQFAIYHLAQGNAIAALGNLRLAIELKGKEGCPLCDDLISTYIDTGEH